MHHATSSRSFLLSVHGSKRIHSRKPGAVCKFQGLNLVFSELESAVSSSPCQGKVYSVPNYVIRTRGPEGHIHCDDQDFPLHKLRILGARPRESEKKRETENRYPLKSALLFVASMFCRHGIRCFGFVRIREAMLASLV